MFPKRINCFVARSPKKKILEDEIGMTSKKPRCKLAECRIQATLICKIDHKKNRQAYRAQAIMTPKQVQKNQLNLASTHNQINPHHEKTGQYGNFPMDFSIQIKSI